MGVGASGEAHRAAFEDFVRGEAAHFARLAYVLTGSREATSDLVQDTLVALWRAWPKVTAAENGSAYARRVMVNQHLMRLRRRRVVEVLVDTPEVRIGDHADGLADADAMRTALDRLTVRQRTVLVLRFYEGLDDHEIAAQLRCRRSTVRSLASRALGTLRAQTQLSEPVTRRAP